MSTQNLQNNFIPSINSEVISSTIGHTFDKITNQNFLNNTRQIQEIISSFFAPISAYNSHPYISNNANTIIITIGYWSFNNNINNFSIEALGDLITKIVNTPVEIRIISLKYPYLDAYILSQWISNQLKNQKFSRITKNLFNNIASTRGIIGKNLIGSILGIKIRLAGRLPLESSRPRFTVQSAIIGTFSINGSCSNHRIECASFTSTLKQGSYTVRVWISHSISE